jgi:uncharacterized damage-inducible protein DinB
MSTLEFCRARRKAEQKAFLNVLKALPKDRLDYRPDPRARTAGELAWFMALEEKALLDLLDKGVVDWKDETAPGLEETIATFQKSAEEVDARLAKLDEVGWNKPGKFMVGGQSVWEEKVGEMMWGFLFDAIHHRGQLSTYLRPMGAKVPSIYGPSADDSGQ